MSTLTRDVLDEVRSERENQDVRWGEQNHPDGSGPTAQLAGYPVHLYTQVLKAYNDRANREGGLTWLPILLEEVFEAAEEEDPVRLREELIQVGAVAAAWVECIDRRVRA